MSTPLQRGEASPPNILSIAGSDPSGGAGIQADLKTFAALGCYGMAAVTALTAQNTRGVSGVHVPPAGFLAQQLDAIFADVEVAAIKIGMLASGELADSVGDRLTWWGAARIVLDPVLVATSGDSLGAPDAVDGIRRLMPLAAVVTPNLAEVARLADVPLPRDVAAMSEAGARLVAMGAAAVLVKGGHLGGDAIDVLCTRQGTQSFHAPRIDTRNTHGTGCTLSAAIAAWLGRGADLAAAVGEAKRYLSAALAAADRLHVGSGAGPVNHGYATAVTRAS